MRVGERPADGFLEQLRIRGLDYRPTAPEGAWVAVCPSHDDRTPSLRITEKEDGRLLVHCFVGCETKDVLDALGLDFTDLFPESVKRKDYCPTCGQVMGRSAGR